MFTLKSYSINEQLYLGNKFMVYRGERDSDHAKVIFKTCRSDHPSVNELAVLQHEYQILNQIAAPNVIRVYDLIKNSHQLIIVMEDFNGQALHSYLAGKPLALNIFFNLAIQIIDSLSVLHNKNIIHKDLNPYNIIIHPQTLMIKIADFSIASQLTEESSFYTQPNRVEGTLAYLSPEQTGRMNCPIDYRTDFYSLGVTFYEMLTGTPPFHGEDPLEWIHNHLAQIPPLVSSVNGKIPSQVSKIIAKLLAKSPEERYQSAIGIKSDLIKCQAQWNSNQQIDSFVLGQEDINKKLVISRKLYGRETQVQEILNAFEKIKQGNTQLFTIAGYSGIGKTSLVNEIHKPIVESRGFFSSGKFEQFHHDVPYAAIVQAFRKLVKQIFCEPQAKLDEWREIIRKSVGTNGQVITQTIPEVEILIGKQPPLSELPPTQARNRFETVFCDFVKCFATYEHPLVIFMDDLQWADMSSFELLLLLLRNANLKYFMLVGAYRDNEVSLGHPLLELIHELKKTSNININQVQLNTLNLSSVQHLISETLNQTKEEVKDLAELIIEKTAGNPFFVNTFLMTLYQDKVLHFNVEKLKWEWDIQKINELAITNNVVDLLVFKIERLPETARNSLKVASCLGTQFELNTLAQIEKKLQFEIAQALWPALEKNLLIPIGDGYKLAKANAEYEFSGQKIIYKFAHDRVQQAAYSLMSEQERKETHLQLGRNLIVNCTRDQLDEDVFDIVNHFNSSLELITDKEEKFQIACLNVKAGEKAKFSAAYAPAMACFKNAITLLGEEAWEEHYELAFKMNVGYAECMHLLGRYEEADINFASIVTRAKTKIDKAQISMQQVLSYTIQVKFDEAINAGLVGLETLGMKVAKDASVLQVAFELCKTMWVMHKTSTADILNLPTIENPETKLLLDLVERIAIASYLIAPNFLAIITLRSIRHCLKSGLTPSIAPLFILYAAMHIVGFKRLDYGYDIANLSVNIAEKYDDLRVHATVYFSAAVIPFHCKKPYKELLPGLLKSYNLCRHIGDQIYTNYVISLIPLIMLFKGDELREVEIKVKSMKVIADFTRNIDGLSNLQAFIDVIAILKGEKTLEDLNVLAHNFVNGTIQHSIPVAYANTGSLILMTCCMMEQWDAAEKMFDRMHIYHNLQALNPTFINTEYTFYMGLIALNLYAKSDKFWIKVKYWLWIKRALKRFKFWAKHCPENYAAKYYLLLGSFYEVKGKILNGMGCYDKAMVFARENNLLHIEALILQQMANGYTKRNQQLSSKLYLNEEIYAYASWGALGKCSYLEKSHPEWLLNKTTPNTENKTATTDLSVSNMNIISIFKFTQAISSEIQLDKLLKKLLVVLLQSAGAQRGLLISKSGENWYVEAEGNTREEKIYLSHSESIKNRADLPVNILQYVIQTQELWVEPKLKDSDQTHIVDPYMQQEKPKSLLIMPITYQGQLKGLLYLENKDVSHAFTSEHIQTLTLLAAQAAISLENARLYYQATHDPLTGLANRNLLYQLFTLALQKAKRNHTQIAFLFMDLDGFKKINDTLGHEVGDKLLKYFGDQLKSCIREYDLAVRLGGDEFVAVLENVTDIKTVKQIADRLLECVSVPAKILEHSIKIGTSIGISLYPDNGDDIATLLKKADLALYQVKSQGKGHYQFYSPAINQKINEEVFHERELRNAIESNELRVFYQPIFTSKTKQLVQFEALVRWQHPQKGLLAAKDFIALAEKSNLISLLGEWVVESVCSQIQKWRTEGYKLIPIAINVSSLQFKDKSVSAFLENILQEYKISPNLVELELTESAYMAQSEKILLDVDHLQKIGVKLTIDDFGTYYSSLTYLKRFPFSKVKIDQSFVRDIETDENNRLLIRAIIAMAHSLKLLVVAEGVESEGQLNFLKSENVDLIQGNYLGFPINLEAATKLLSL